MRGQISAYKQDLFLFEVKLQAPLSVVLTPQSDPDTKVYVRRKKKKQPRVQVTPRMVIDYMGMFCVCTFATGPFLGVNRGGKKESNIDTKVNQKQRLFLWEGCSAESKHTSERREILSHIVAWCYSFIWPTWPTVSGLGSHLQARSPRVSAVYFNRKKTSQLKVSSVSSGRQARLVTGKPSRRTGGALVLV